MRRLKEIVHLKQSPETTK
ncbi:hypothetical protein Godav_014066 [Gossypium davidsonii]|uniref:Uncharacterized protein n=2 Tax=Gossypium TaxID=3633 RepID=A0A7J8RJE0_GOSDV|nr:hypothetical protein [Gossypium davidsonii]MBA0648855.1 hypothetical protein [Gossypium klotzschianum]